MIDTDWIAVDWGTSTLRAWAMSADGSVLATGRSDQGMGTLTPGPKAFEEALLNVISPWLTEGRKTEVIACGMVGSRQGWAEARYREVPTAPGGKEAVVTAISHDPRLDVKIVCGICQKNPPDVMRGEETQMAGFLARNPEFEGVLALPGTHTKWVQIIGGEVFHFASFMTGELFALLSKHSVLRHSLSSNGFDESAFCEAIDDALARPERVAARLFTIRASDLLQGVEPHIASSRLSGELLGLELAGARPYWLGQQIALVADKSFETRYRLAFERTGASFEVHDPDQLVLDGLSSVYALVNGKEMPCLAT